MQTIIMYVLSNVPPGRRRLVERAGETCILQPMYGLTEYGVGFLKGDLGILCGWTTKWILRQRGQRGGELGWPLMSLLMESSASRDVPICNSDGTGLTAHGWLTFWGWIGEHGVLLQ